jgi:DNA-binding transcriptional LysR family regulator
LQRYLAMHAAHCGKPMKARIRLRSFDAVCRMVENGVGISVIPRTAAQRCQQAMAIRAYPLTDSSSVRRLTICLRGVEQLPVYTRQLIEEIKERGE